VTATIAILFYCRDADLGLKLISEKKASRAAGSSESMGKGGAGPAQRTIGFWHMVAMVAV
jgi:hypothetical protein